MIKVTQIGFVWQVLTTNDLEKLPFHKLELYRVWPDERCARIFTLGELRDALTRGEMVAIPLGNRNEAFNEVTDNEVKFIKDLVKTGVRHLGFYQGGCIVVKGRGTDFNYSLRNGSGHGGNIVSGPDLSQVMEAAKRSGWGPISQWK